MDQKSFNRAISNGMASLTEKERVKMEAANYTLEGLKTAYSKMTYSDFAKLINDGREDDYLDNKWLAFKEMMHQLEKLGTFFPIIVNHGHELRSK